MKELREYLFKNVDKLLEVVQELNRQNGLSEEFKFYKNDEHTINKLFTTPYEFAKKSNHIEYDFNEEFFRFDNCGDVVSYTYYDMVDEIRDNIDEVIEALQESNINDLNDLLIKEYIGPVDMLMDWSKGSKEMER